MSAETTEQLLGRRYNTVPQFLQPVDFRIVERVNELQTAGQLTYREYLKRGYITPMPSQCTLSPYHALPTTATFIAVYHGTFLIGTITLVQDSPLGLPMDEVYKPELDALRAQGHRLAEASLLALNTDIFGHGVFTMFNAKKLLLTLRLFKIMFDYLRSSTDVDELVACFNPKHEILYDFLQLKPLGGLRSYAGANGNPAIARHLNVPETEQRAKAHVAYRLFFGATPSPEPFAGKLALSPAHLRTLFVEQSPILASARPDALAFIKRSYPAYNFDAIL